MPVVRTCERAMQEGNRPEWCGVTSAGIFEVPREHAGRARDVGLHAGDHFGAAGVGREFDAQQAHFGRGANGSVARDTDTERVLVKVFHAP